MARDDFDQTAGKGLDLPTYEALELFGFSDEDRLYSLPIPEEGPLSETVTEAFDLLANLLNNTGLEAELEPLMWGFVNLLHRRAERIAQAVDRLVLDLKASREAQDSSEVRDTELQKLIVRAEHGEFCQTAFEQLRDAAIARYEECFKKAWTPSTGSVAGRVLTAAIIDARDFERARKARTAQAFDPGGIPIIAFGDFGYTDYERVNRVMDSVFSFYPGMTLHHPGGNKGFGVIIREWARTRKVNQVQHEPDFKLGKAAAFRRNDKMLELSPALVVLFGEASLTLNMGQKAEAKKFKVIRR